MKIRPAIFAAVLSLFGDHVLAQYYSASNGDWTNGATWVGGSVPVNGNLVGIEGGNTVTFSTGTYTTGGWDGNFQPLGVGVNFGSNPGAGTLNISGGTLNANGLFMGHETAAGAINQSGGIFNVYGVNTLIGWGSTATINVSGGTMNMTGGAGTFRLGHSSAASLNVSGTGVANLSGTIGLAASGSQINVNGGTLNISNATLSFAANTRLTARSNGVINMLAGTQTIGVSEGLWLGTDATTGTLNLSGGTWTQNSFVRMGVYASGNGIINQTGGTFEMGGTFEAWGSSPSAYNLSGGTFRTLTNGVQINTYSGGPMTFNITGSSGNVTMDTPYNFTAPNSSVFNNAAATLTKTGAGTLTVAGQLDVRNGALNMSNGTLETVTATVIGSSSGSASGTMSGGTLRTGYLGGGNFVVGNSGATGTLTQSGGTNQVGSLANTVIGWNSGSTGTYTLNGGTFTGISNITFVGIGGTGTLNVSGGTYSGYNTLVGHSAGGVGTVNVGSGSFTTDYLTVGGNNATSGTLNLNGGTFGVNQTFVVDTNGTINVNTGGALSGGASGNLTVQNGGVVKFNGGTGNGSMNLLLSGGIVDLNGQSIATNGWANLVASGAGSILRNSSASAATIADGNTIWIWNAATNLTIDASGGNITIDSRITSSGQPNPTGIIKTGTNNLVLTYANDYTGTTTVNAGLLAVRNGSALGSTAGGTIVADGGRLSLGGGGAGVTVGNEALTISGTGGTNGWALRTANNLSSTWGGKITLAADATIQAGTGSTFTMDVASGDALDLGGFTSTFNGAGMFQINDSISGAGGKLIKDGTGTMTLSAANTYSGGTTISAGALQLTNGGSVAGNITNNATLSVNRTDSSTISNVISGSGALIKSGAGTLALAAANSYDGVTTVAAGVLRIGNSSALGSTNGATVVQSGAQLRLITGVAGATSYGNGEALTISGDGGSYLGALRSGVSGETNTYQGKVSLADNASINAGSGTGLILDVSSGDAVDLGANTLTFLGAGAHAVNDAIVGTGGITKIGTGSLTLAASNSYSGATDIQDGRLTLSGNGRLGSGAITISNARTLELAVTGTNMMANSISGAGQLLASSGTTALSASNSYGGGTTLAGGTLRLDHANAAGTGTITQSNGTFLQINTTGTVANAMSIFNVQTMQTVTLSGNKTLNNATYTVDAGTTTTESGVLSGSGGITKEGAGTLIATASNSFTGNTLVNAGVLNLNSSTGSALGASTNVTVSATLLISQSDQVSDSAAVTLSGGTIQRGAGVSEAFGNLNITTGSFLDFGTGATGNLTFGTYQNNETPSALLTLNNFLPGNSFTFTSTSFTANDVGSYFAFGTGYVNSTISNTGTTFTITAIPEPSTVIAAIGLFGLMLWPSRRRLLQHAKASFGFSGTAA